MKRQDRYSYSSFETTNWEDLRLFLAVARAAGLASATAASGASAPTLSRRMTSLEKAMGCSLFHRHREGYDLTEAGEELLELATRLESGAHAIERWRMRIEPRPTVKVAAGLWSATFIARHVREFIGRKGAPIVDLLGGTAPVDLLRREASIGLRNRRPETGGLAGRRLARVEFAAYGSRSLGAPSPALALSRLLSDYDWIVLDHQTAPTPSMTWLETRLEKPAALRCSSPHVLLEAARAGAGLCILPCFVGDPDPGLMRLSGLIDELRHDQWLVTHDDDRHSKPVRLVADWLAKLVRSKRAAFAGEEAAAGS